MSYRLSKILLQKYINISFLCKTIELVTILTLQLYKNKIIASQKIIKLFFCFLKENYKNNFLSLNHLVIPIFTDKSCSGIINNLLWSHVKELFVLSLYQNLIISFLGTSLKFKKTFVLTNYTKSIVSNLYNLSDETVNFYVSFMLLKEIIFLEYEYFIFYFNEFVNIYYQVVNYYLIRSLQELINIYLYNDIMFLLKDLHTIINIYLFLVSVIILDILEFTMYSELGSRANSMTNSIQNSKENVRYYTLIFNRYRQAKITNEIIEIISSSNI